MSGPTFHVLIAAMQRRALNSNIDLIAMSDDMERRLAELQALLAVRQSANKESGQ